MLRNWLRRIYWRVIYLYRMNRAYPAVTIEDCWAARMRSHGWEGKQEKGQERALARLWHELHAVADDHMNGR